MAELEMYVLDFYLDPKERSCRVALEGSMTIGRGPSSAIRLGHPSVSRRHATISVNESESHAIVVFTDEGSSNGTLVNGRRLAPGDSVRVKPGDQINIGAYHALLLQEDQSGEADGEEEFDFDTGHVCIHSLSIERLRALCEFSHEAPQLVSPALFERAARILSTFLSFETMFFVFAEEHRQSGRDTWTPEGFSNRASLRIDPGVLEKTLGGREVVFTSDDRPAVATGGTMILGSRAAIVCVPIADGDHCFGALCLRSDATDERFGLDDLQFIILVARSVARSLRVHAKLLGEGSSSQHLDTESTICISEDVEIAAHRETLQKITEQRTSALIAARDEADAANRTKSEFLANMSHELRTPLHAILSFADFGVARHETAQREKLGHYFRHIHASGTTLLSLLNDLLDLAKLEAGKMSFKFEKRDLQSLVSQVVEEFATMLADLDVTVEREDPGSPVEAAVDAERTKQVLRNLIGNAIKFSPEGGRIWIGRRLTDTSVGVSIRDEGPGIPEDELQTVFDKFVQSSNTKTGSGGTGLGLAICNMIVTAHKGRIWAENNSSGGAVFSFLVPKVGESKHHAKESGVENEQTIDASKW